MQACGTPDLGFKKSPDLYLQADAEEQQQNTDLGQFLQELVRFKTD